MADVQPHTEPADRPKMTVSIAAQLGPLGRYERPDADPMLGTDIEQYAKDLTRYIAQNLERFADPRGGDVYVAVAVKCGEQSAAESFRSGHYVDASVEV